MNADGWKKWHEGLLGGADHGIARGRGRKNGRKETRWIADLPFFGCRIGAGSTGSRKSWELKRKVGTWLPSSGAADAGIFLDGR